MGLVELLSDGVSATQKHGLAPFALAFVILAPAALIAIAIEFWFELPGSFLLVGLLMAAFAVYLASVTPLLVNDEAAARQRSLAATIDRAEASMPVLVLAGVANGLIVAAGLELRLLPGFLLLGLFALTVPAAIREKRGPIASLRRGLGLTQGNAPAFAALGAIIGAAALAAYAVLVFVLEPLPGFLGELVAVTVTTTLAAPIAAHVFVRAFDGRTAGRRLAIRPAERRGAGARGRAALQRTLGSLGDSRTAPRQGVAFTSRTHPDAAPLRYSPDAATQTLRLPSLHQPRTSMPDWASVASVDEATVEELHSAV